MNKHSLEQKLPPLWLIKAINAFRAFLLRLNRNLFPANVVLYEQFELFWLLPSLYVAAKFDIATILKNKPLTAQEISELLDIDAENISRILRALASHGIFKQKPDGHFANNAMSEALLDEPGSLRYMVLHHLGPVNWSLMSNLSYAVRTGKDAFAEKYGKEIYDYLADHPDESALFDKSMSNLSDLGLSPILHAYDFSRFPLIADIGGGEGFLLGNILAKNHKARGILFDTPPALNKAPAMLARYQVEDRIDVMPGDFFQTRLPAAGLYILKNIVHNWSDEKSVLLLQNMSKSMDENSRVLIIEMIVPTGNKPSLAKLLDIQMLATMTGGKERTEEEFRSLLRKSGFVLTRVIPTLAPLSLIEARKTG